MKTITILSLLILSACSYTPKPQTFTVDEAKKIYQKGIEDSKPKDLAFFVAQDGDAYEKAASLNILSFNGQDGKNIFMLDSNCKLDGSVKIKTKGYEFYKSISKKFCPYADFSQIEKSAVIQKIATIKPVAK